MEVLGPIPSDHGIDLSLLRKRIEAGRMVGGTVYTAGEVRTLLDAALEGGVTDVVPAKLFLGALSLLVQGAVRDEQVVPLSTGIAEMLVDIVDDSVAPLIPQQPDGQELIV